MANQIPLSGAANISGGYLLPPEQGEILVNGILIETGALAIAGDARATTARKTNFPIWLGRPTAGPVAEGAAKPVTGASFGQASLNIQKFASIILFTDEQIEDLMNGDLNVLADAGVRQALSVAIDQQAVGYAGSANLGAASVFDSVLIGAGNAGVFWDHTKTDATGLQVSVSAAMGLLEANGYGNPDDIGVLLGFGFQQNLRDARDVNGRPLYDGGTYAGQVIDGLYGLTRAHSTALAPTSSALSLTVSLTATSSATFTTSAQNLFVGQPISGTNVPNNTTIATLTYSSGLITGGTLSAATTGSVTTVTASPCVGVVVHRPNVHVRVRQDVTVAASNEASIVNGGTTYNLFQENLTALRYETRLGFMVHDAANSVIPIWAK